MKNKRIKEGELTPTEISKENGSLDLLAQSILRMWSEVPVEAIETAPSSVGMFEREEIGLVGGEIAQQHSYSKNSELLLLGAATAVRELSALSIAEGKLGFTPTYKKITAVDIAPQFVQSAIKNLQKLQDSGQVQEVVGVVGSIDELSLEERTQKGSITLGLYDLSCLLSKAQEKDGELVGLDQYAAGMSEILGNHTTVIPLFYEGGKFLEGTAIVSYDSSKANLEKMREELQAFYRKNRQLIGMTVRITKDVQNYQSGASVFSSTWFDARNLQKVFRKEGFSGKIVKPVDAKKGFVMTLTSQDSASGRHALLMNNVLGNVHIDVLNNLMGTFKKI